METIAAENPRSLDALRPLMADIPWRYQNYGEEILRVLNDAARFTY